MRSTRRFYHRGGGRPLGGAIAAVLLLSFGAAAEDSAGSVKDLKGEAFAQTSAARRELAPQAAILLGDNVHTGDQSRVTMLLGRQTTLRLGARGSVLIDKFLVEAGGEITLQSGPLMLDHAEGAPAEPVQIRTPYGLIAVRGTRVFVGPEGKGWAVFVERGEVSVQAGGPPVMLHAGEGTAIAAAGARPARVAKWKVKRIDTLFGDIR
jgi:ferric-dicitrate binding protein FerR (iron transport regulator)